MRTVASTSTTAASGALLDTGDQAVVELLAVAATGSSLSLAAAGTRRHGGLSALRTVPVLIWLTLGVLVLLEADAVSTGNSQLALLLIADGLAVRFALAVRGELLDARLIRLQRQRASHRAQLRSLTQPGHVAPHGHLTPDPPLILWVEPCREATRCRRARLAKGVPILPSAGLSEVLVVGAGGWVSSAAGSLGRWRARC